MSGLAKKLVRDLRTLRWQLISIAMVLAAGVQALIAPFGTFRSLEHARERFYARTAFPQLFVRLTRAPDPVSEALARIEGIAAVETRLTFDVPIDLEGVREPVVGRVISLAPASRPRRARLVIESGRLPNPRERLEVAINEAFAKARGLDLGDELPAVLAGRREELTVVGIVHSPEHIAALRSGDVIPDDAHFGVLFLSYATLASAYDARGTFNEAVFWLAPGASTRASIGAIDRLLAPYGGYGAYDRTEQPAHRFVDSELDELEVEAIVLPAIFLGVAAFLLNIVLARIVAQERTQIATLRALGFRKGPIVRHYLMLASCVAGAGVVVGTGLGFLLGVAMTATYREFFRFPDLAYEIDAGVVAVANVTSFGAALLGALGATRRIASLAPAAAMQPPPPLAFHTSWLEQSGLTRRLAPSLRLVVRNVASKPVRTLTVIVGVSAAMGLLVVGAFWNDALDGLIVQQFQRARREAVTVTFVAPQPERAVRELAHVRGVRLAEGIRAVPVRFSVGLRQKRTELLGLPSGGTLRRIVSGDGSEVELPAEGLVLSHHLARALRAGPGAQVNFDVLEGERQHRVLTVGAVVDERLGMSAYMRADALARILDEKPSVSGALLALEPGRESEVHRALREFPSVASVAVKRAVLRRFEQTLMQIIIIFSLVLSLFGGVVVAGVVYNAARMLVAERARELATLRVLGFTRGDISEALLLELAVQIVPALGLGALMGYGLAALAVRLFGPQDMSIPLVIGARTWALALAVVIGSAVASALIVRRRLDRLDLVGTLKVRE